MSARIKSTVKDQVAKPGLLDSLAKSTGQPVITTATNEEKQDNFSIEEIQEFGDECLGLKVVVTAREATYMGVISYILPACRRLALEKVCNPKTGKKMIGLLTLFFHDILNISVIGEDKEARQRLLKEVYHEDQRGKQLLMKKLVRPHIVNHMENISEMDEDVLLGRVKQNPPVGDGNSPKDKKNSPPPPARIPRPSKWVVIDTLDDAMKKALTFIQSESVIALGMEGKKLGRTGTLAWVTIATTSMIFLFDMAKMGASQVLQEGLGDIIQDSRIMKVVHDCRALEDLLYHQFSLNLRNVFDTQAAEVYIYMLNHHGAVPSFVTGLPSLLIHYLGLSPHHLFFPHVRQECAESDESVWMERPLSSHLCEGLARGVMYLRELRLEMLDFMLVDLVQITNLYLGALRDKDSLTANNIERHVVPAEVQRVGHHSVINSVDIHDPYILYTRNGSMKVKRN